MTAAHVEGRPATPAVLVHTALAKARAARELGMATAEEADILGWDRALIDQGIGVLAAAAVPFSANLLRELLPEVRQPLMGARFMAAARQGIIIRVGEVTSTKENTHAKGISLWVGTDHLEEHALGVHVHADPVAEAVHRILEEELGHCQTLHGNRRRWRIANRASALIRHGQEHP